MPQRKLPTPKRKALAVQSTKRWRQRAAIGNIRSRQAGQFIATIVHPTSSNACDRADGRPATSPIRNLCRSPRHSNTI